MKMKDALLMANLYVLSPSLLALMLWGPGAQILVGLAGYVALRLRFRIG